MWLLILHQLIIVALAATLSRGDPLFGGLLSYGFQGSQWSVYRDDRTLAAVKYASSGSDIEDCHIFDLDKHEAAASNLISRLQQEYQHPFPVTETNLNQTLAIINSCRTLDLHRNPTMAALHTKSLSTPRGSPSTGLGMANLTELSSLWRGIVPGTKWCGAGDEASDYNDIGFKALVDSCCRSHDLCPSRLRPFRMGYGLINLSVYTK